MTTPRPYPKSQAGEELHDSLHADDDPCTYGMTGVCDIAEEVAEVEAQAAQEAVEPWRASVQDALDSVTRSQMETKLRSLLTEDGK